MNLAQQINHHHKLANAMAVEALDHARQAGLLLIEAKAACRHGDWLPWLSVNCTVGIRQAQKYIRLAERWPELANANQGTHLTLSAALAALAEPKEAEPNEWLPTGHDVATAYLAYAGKQVTAMVQNSTEHPGYFWVLCLILDTDEAEECYMRRPVLRDYVADAFSCMLPIGSPAPASLAWQYQNADPCALHKIISGGAS